MRLLHLALSLALLAVAGCAYRPLYAEQNGSAHVVDTLSRIEIAEAETRLGQIVRNDLISAMRPAGAEGGDGEYRLTLKADDKTQGMIANAQPSVTRRSMLVTVEFELFKGDKSVLTGTASSRTSFDVIREPFADMQAQKNALERVAHEVSGDIKLRLAAYLARS